MNNTTWGSVKQVGVDQPTIQAIEVNYKGIRFRSKLEARHAMLLDEFGIIWEYEPHYLKAGGQSYLPDFLLPEIKTYLEVKGDTVPGRERAIEVMAECWKVGVVSQETRFVISNGVNPEIWAYTDCIYPESPDHPDEPKHLRFTRDGQLFYVYRDVTAIVRCEGCTKKYFIEGLRSWTCPACGRNGTGFRCVQEKDYAGNRTLDELALLGEVIGGSFGFIALPQIRTDWK